MGSGVGRDRTDYTTCTVEAPRNAWGPLFLVLLDPLKQLVLQEHAPLANLVGGQPLTHEAVHGLVAHPQELLCPSNVRRTRSTFRPASFSVAM